MTDDQAQAGTGETAEAPKAQQALYKVAEIIDHGEGEQGALVGVKLGDGQGRNLVVLVPHEKLGEVMVRFRAGASFAAATRAGRDPKKAGAVPIPLQASSGHVHQARSGQMYFRFNLQDGLQIDVPLKDDALRPLAEAFAKAADAADNLKNGGAKPEAPEA